MSTERPPLEASLPRPAAAPPLRGCKPWLAVLCARRMGSLPWHCLVTVPLALLPSVVLMGLAIAIATALGIDVAQINAPYRGVSAEQFFSGVVFAPIAETLLQAGGLWLLSRLSSRPLFVAATSGLLWGALHGSFGALWFFGTCWTFYVLSCSYLSWRPVAWWKGFAAAALPHACINLTVLLLLTQRT